MFYSQEIHTTNPTVSEFLVNKIYTVENKPY